MKRYRYFEHGGRFYIQCRRFFLWRMVSVPDTPPGVRHANDFGRAEIPLSFDSAYEAWKFILYNSIKRSAMILLEPFVHWQPFPAKKPTSEGMKLVCAPSADAGAPFRGLAWWSVAGQRWELINHAWSTAITHWAEYPALPSFEQPAPEARQFLRPAVRPQVSYSPVRENGGAAEHE